MTEAAVATKSDAKWYIVHTYSNFEKKVSEEIRRQAKLQDLDEFVAICQPSDHDIARLYIAMNDSLFVRCSQCRKVSA